MPDQYTIFGTVDTTAPVRKVRVAEHERRAPVSSPKRRSAKAHDEFVESGGKRKLRDLVLDALRSRQNSGLTGAELNEVVGNNSAHKRLSELKRAGLVVEYCERVCSLTGKRVAEWRAS